MKKRSCLLTLVAAFSVLALMTTPAEAGGRKKHFHRGWNGDRYGYYNRGWDRGYYRPYYRYRPVYYGPARCYRRAYYNPGPVFFFGFGFR